MHVLARGTEQRLLDLEQLQLDAAIQGLSDEQSLVVLMLEFLLRHEPGGALMSKSECAHWLRRGMPPAGLPRRLRPALARAQAMAQCFLAAAAAGETGEGEKHDDDVVAWCCWLADASSVEC
jgi:hypothetical protein